MNKQWRIILVILALSVVSAMLLRACLHPPLKLSAAQLLPAAKPMLQDYVLSNGAKQIQLNQIRGHWVLIFFGYTSCPDVCPLELQKLGQMLKHFDMLESKKKPLVIFVSVDPERDKPEMLKKYVSYFHQDLLGLTASNVELAALANFFGASFNRTVTISGKDYLVEAGADMPGTAGDHYLVNHSSRIFVMDPQARYVGSFAPPYDTAALIADVEQLLRQP
jgi:protein SCO1/2